MSWPGPAMCNANTVRNQLSMSSGNNGGGSSQSWDANTDWLDLNFIDWVSCPPFCCSDSLNKLTKSSLIGIALSAI